MNRWKKATTMLVLLTAGLLTGCGDSSKTEEVHSFAVWEKTEDAVGAVYWPVVIAIYLGWSFWTGKWGVTWVVWPVAALLCAAVVSAGHAARRK